MNHPLLRTTDLEIGHLNGKPAKKVVASGLNLDLFEGEFVCLVGPNGAGKSTLLRSMTGLLPVLGGEIEINGKKLAQFTRKELAYQISVVLTSPIEVGAMSVKELVAMGRFPFTGLFDRMSEKDWQIVQQALKMVGIEGFEDRLIHKLSDGERQKVMIARALAQEPRILILDEPTAYLDLPGRVSVMNLMRELSSEHGKTVLTSTHDLDLAMRSADRFWLMSAGGEIIQGAPEDLVLSGDFQRIFARDKVSFDSQNGHFSVANKGEEHVSLKGEGDARIWTERALQRIGFQVFDEIEGQPSLRIDIQEDEEGVYWEVNDKRTSQRFGSLGDLTSYFRSLKNQDNLNSD
jgi:iron complex transport system ATP-binding protein